MKKIKIITDSTADLPKEIYEKYDIEVLPVLINFKEESYLDGVEINPDKVFEKIEKNNILPTTGQVIPSRFIETYKKYLDKGYKILSIHMSSAMSGTYQSACIAKNTLESDDVIVVDSQNIAPALGILVLKAAVLLDNGNSLDDVFKEINSVKYNVKTLMCFESLEYLIRGGRISKTAGMVGSVFGIKLILDIKDGLMSVKDKVRGNKKAIKKIIAELEEAKLDEDVPVILADAKNVEIKASLLKYLQENNIKYMECPLGSSVCIHSGPDCCGIVYLTK
ncbi:DegV family protein [Clostridium botulinum]|uniref:DegV family protein n=1 Tax=Clostridium botulinum TaxID=1491 RepID=A0A6B4JHB2_CLOBO|nr:DegV family protein [Clostridium botulinum]EES49688.1 DegV family protein [Clostridium botulinum E1 str. 'BoNT E Beluga']MBY6759661.1 DegV family protein [Clostridium botulinum]MBY6918569.1 DegV family protein [Clostridium botulinum]MCR1129653.1 DegV family protein [Clostridium botulinum]NFJ56386.1 DegV family protein [Clostridium botulinum]